MQQTEYLSDTPDRLIHVEQGWGVLGYDVCAHAEGQTPLPLQIGTRSYKKGLGSHARGLIVVDLGGGCTAFDAEVGVEKQDSAEGSVVFKVLVDGQKRFESPVMRQDSAPIPVHIELNGAQELRLVMGDAGDGITCDAADWAEARLTVDPNAKPRAVEEFDLARFGQVTTWDPKRMDGARAARIEEFHADDVYLDRPVQGSRMLGWAMPANACIGLLWNARQRPTILRIEDTGLGKIDPSKVEVQAWTGIFPFQGTWKPLVGVFKRDEDALTFHIDPKANPEFVEGFRKVRWVLPRGTGLGAMVHLSALKMSRIRTADVRIQAEPHAGRTADVDYLGCEPDVFHSASLLLAKPPVLRLRYPAEAAWDDGPNQPMLRFQLGHGTYTVNVRDVLGQGVYLPDAGLFLSKPGDTLAAYRKRFAAKKTVLERVRSMPDQSFAHAMKKTYRDTHFGSPTLLSVGADNWKWLVETNGSVVWEPEPEVADKQMPFERRRCRLAVTVNGNTLTPVRDPKPAQGMKRWMPVVRQATKGAKLTAFAAPIGGRRGLFLGKVGCDGSTPVDMVVSFQTDRNTNAPAQVTIHGTRALVMDGERVMAAIDLRELGNLRAVAEPSALHIQGQGVGSLLLAIPGWEATAADPDLQNIDEPKLAKDFAAYWNDFKARGMDIEIPDPFLSDIIASSQVRCFVDARNRDEGAKLAPWIAEIHYGPLESEANTIVRGMGLVGHSDFTEKCLDYFIDLYNPAGFLTTGYTLVGTGWHLWTLGEAYALRPNPKWLESHADEIARVCRWVIAQRRKTMKMVDGKKPPQYGLFTPGVIADWSAYQYYFYTNGTYCAGLEAIGKAFKSIGRPDGDVFLDEAKAYRKDIVHAYRRTQGLTPAVALQDGTWVPGQPSQVHCPGPLSGYYPGDDGSRSWCYDVELGANNMVQQGVLPEDGTDSKEMADYLEDHMYLQGGWGDYPADETAKDWFDLGGFAKVQPYYGRLQEVYAMRDDVKPFIRGYFNMIASLVDPSNLTVWEHFDHYGAPDKTHETGVFLQQTRFMLVKERGDELWLAPMVTSNWLEQGMAVGVKNAPTFFGDVSYRIVSHVRSGYIEATVEPPTRTAPKAVVVRLRHPQGLRIKSVTVNGKAWKDFDPRLKVVRVKGIQGRFTVVARF